MGLVDCGTNGRGQRAPARIAATIERGRGKGNRVLWSLFTETTHLPLMPRGAGIQHLAQDWVPAFHPNSGLPEFGDEKTEVG